MRPRLGIIGRNKQHMGTNKLPHNNHNYRERVSWHGIGQVNNQLNHCMPLAMAPEGIGDTNLFVKYVGKFGPTLQWTVVCLWKLPFLRITKDVSFQEHFTLLAAIYQNSCIIIGTLRPPYIVIGYMVFPAIWSIFGWSRTEWDIIHYSTFFGATILAEVMDICPYFFDIQYHH